MVGSVERGDANPSLETIHARLLDGTGVDTYRSGRPRRRPDRPAAPGRRGACRCSPHVQRRFETEGWLTAREASDRERGRYVGWIDLLAFHPPTGTLLIIEIKTEIHDFGDIERSMDAGMRRGAWDAARRLGWRPKTSRIVAARAGDRCGGGADRGEPGRPSSRPFLLRADATTTLVA
ncbi:MAG: hypothetical protein WKF78_07765 [Candidatus Limnocylindrales bacterium]